MAAKFRKGIHLNNQRATDAADGTQATDLVTLQQLQAAIRGLDWKDSVRAATTSTVTATGPQTVDGVSVVAGNRVARMGDGVNNGIWIVNAGAWTRAVDFDADAEVTAGLAFSVEEGTANGDKAFILTTNNPIVVGTTSLTFSVLGGGGAAYTAATNGGLSVTGNAFSVVAGNGIVVDATGVRVDTTIVTRSYQADCVATTNPQTFTHGLGKRPNVDVILNATNTVEYPDIQITTTTIVIDWGSAPAAGEYRVLANG